MLPMLTGKWLVKLQEGTESPKKPRSNRVQLEKVDGFTKDLFRRTVYESYDEKHANNFKSPGKDHYLSYEFTLLRELLKLIGFHFCKINIGTVLIEIPRIAAWWHI